MNTPDLSSKRLWFILSTHWDREWYSTFQEYRFRFVDLMDHVMDGIRDGRLKGPFMMDGQSIPMDDYLEMRPERRDEFEENVRENRIVLGPWFVMPDVFLVSGESQIRNLELGRKMAESCGGTVSRCVNTCDSFGFHSQIPQIFQQQDLSSILLIRGTHMENNEHHFLWRGADGTVLPTYRYAQNGYWGYSVNVRSVNGRETPFPREEFLANLRSFIQTEASETEVDAIMLFDGMDHAAWDEECYEHLQAVKAELPCELRHGSLDDYMQDVLRQQDRITVKREGELREFGADKGEGDYALLNGTLSARVWIKQTNNRIEHLLTQQAEPLEVFYRAVYGKQAHPGFMDVAWKHLLTNHAHDSICGCSRDDVHTDMENRFKQASEIGSEAAERVLKRLTSRVVSELKDGQIPFVVYNPLEKEVKGVMDVTLDLPCEWWDSQKPFTQRFPNIEILDEDGNLLEFQGLRMRLNRARRETSLTLNLKRLAVHELDVSIPLQLPAMGHRLLYFRPAEGFHHRPWVRAQGLAAEPGVMENEFLRVETAGAVIRMLDKQTGVWYEDLLNLEDRGEMATAFQHCPPVENLTLYSRGLNASVAVRQSGALTAQTEIRFSWDLPAGMDPVTLQRSERVSPVKVKHLLTLRAGARELEVHTEIDNTAKDHRMRLCLPTGTGAGRYYTDTPFDVVERCVGIREEAFTQKERPNEIVPQKSMTLIGNRSHGLAVVSAGLQETAVLPDAPRTVALTLFRSFEQYLHSNGEPGGQGIGLQKFDLVLMPVDGWPDRPSSDLIEKTMTRGKRLNNPHRVTHTAGNFSEFPECGQTLPPIHSFAELKGNAQLSSFRLVDQGLEIRCWNPGFESADVVLKLDERLGDVFQFPDDSADIPLTLDTKKITTLLFPYKVSL